MIVFYESHLKSLARTWGRDNLTWRWNFLINWKQKLCGHKNWWIASTFPSSTSQKCELAKFQRQALNLSIKIHCNYDVFQSTKCIMAPDSLKPKQEFQMKPSVSDSGRLKPFQANNKIKNKKQAIILHIFRSLICTLVKNAYALEAKNQNTKNKWEEIKDPRIIIPKQFWSFYGVHLHG